MTVQCIHGWFTKHEIRTEKGSDICQHKIKLVLTFAKNDQTLVEICTVALYFGSDICQIKLGFVQVNPKSAQKISDVRLLFHALLYLTTFSFLLLLCQTGDYWYTEWL